MLSEEEIKLVELDLKSGDRVKVASYDSFPQSEKVIVTHEVAIVKAVDSYSVTIRFITGKQEGKLATALPSTLTKLESAIDALGATGDAGEVSTVGWDELEG